jgi:hypothetical protein
MAAWQFNLCWHTLIGWQEGRVGWWQPYQPNLPLELLPQQTSFMLSVVILKGLKVNW